MLEALGPCWVWLKGVKTGGYGVLVVDNVTRAAHRISWFLTHGPIPDGLHVLHRCDNPPCVNPAHLFLGTASDNAKDRSAKNRSARQRGEAHGMARLTDASVALIRWRLLCGEAQASVARDFRVDQGRVSKIRGGLLWQHVSPSF